MKEKNLAYSVETLNGFLEDMKEVKKIKKDYFTYKNAHIRLKPFKGINSLFAVERSIMTLEGEEKDIEEFYYIFLINHMTMGG